LVGLDRRPDAGRRQAHRVGDLRRRRLRPGRVTSPGCRVLP
jgi:hypothetical protein